MQKKLKRKISNILKIMFYYNNNNNIIIIYNVGG